MKILFTEQESSQSKNRLITVSIDTGECVLNVGCITSLSHGNDLGYDFSDWRLFVNMIDGSRKQICNYKPAMTNMDLNEFKQVIESKVDDIYDTITSPHGYIKIHFNSGFSYYVDYDYGIPHVNENRKIFEQTALKKLWNSVIRQPHLSEICIPSKLLTLSLHTISYDEQMNIVEDVTDYTL